jgi:ATP-binding cassette subfamily B multidrug efflux pump
MSISDAIYRPFETLIQPLDIPYRPLPCKGPVAVLLHFISMFRGVLIALALSSMAIEAINLTIVWGLSVIVDGVTQQGASAFLRNEWPLLTFLGLLIFPAMPVASFLLNTLNSHTLGVGMPAAIQWQGHKAVERQDLAFFHDLFAGQVASRLSQVASAVQQQIIAAFQSIPRFVLQMVGSVSCSPAFLGNSPYRSSSGSGSTWRSPSGWLRSSSNAHATLPSSVAWWPALSPTFTPTCR